MDVRLSLFGWKMHQTIWQILLDFARILIACAKAWRQAESILGSKVKSFDQFDMP